MTIAALPSLKSEVMERRWRLGGGSRPSVPGHHLVPATTVAGLLTVGYRPCRTPAPPKAFISAEWK